jgi:hypothetical protein
MSSATARILRDPARGAIETQRVKNGGEMLRYASTLPSPLSQREACRVHRALLPHSSSALMLA